MTHEGNDTLKLHDEITAFLPALPARVFALIDDPKRLVSHMSKASWRMGGGYMTTTVDDGLGQRVGSHIVMSGHILGIELSLDEVITQPEPPARKVWETVGSPSLLVIGSYRLGFEAAAHEGGTLLRAFIDYALPASWPARWLGRLFGRYYAHWCIRSMVDDTARHLAAAEAAVRMT